MFKRHKKSKKNTLSTCKHIHSRIQMKTHIDMYSCISIFKIKFTSENFIRYQFHFFFFIIFTFISYHFPLHPYSFARFFVIFLRVFLVCFKKVSVSPVHLVSFSILHTYNSFIYTNTLIYVPCMLSTCIFVWVFKIFRFSLSNSFTNFTHEE